MASTTSITASGERYRVLLQVKVSELAKITLECRGGCYIYSGRTSDFIGDITSVESPAFATGKEVINA